jgi:hypothetical protein
MGLPGFICWLTYLFIFCEAKISILGKPMALPGFIYSLIFNVLVRSPHFFLLEAFSSLEWKGLAMP